MQDYVIIYRESPREELLLLPPYRYLERVRENPREAHEHRGSITTPYEPWDLAVAVNDIIGLQAQRGRPIGPVYAYRDQSGTHIVPTHATQHSLRDTYMRLEEVLRADLATVDRK